MSRCYSIRSCVGGAGRETIATQLFVFYGVPCAFNLLHESPLLKKACAAMIDAIHSPSRAAAAAAAAGRPTASIATEERGDLSFRRLFRHQGEACFSSPFVDLARKRSGRPKSARSAADPTPAPPPLPGPAAGGRRAGGRHRYWA